MATNRHFPCIIPRQSDHKAFDFAAGHWLFLKSAGRKKRQFLFVEQSENELNEIDVKKLLYLNWILGFLL